LLTGAVINQPQVAILSTDSVVRKPVVVTEKNGAESVGIHSVGLLALTLTIARLTARTRRDS